MTVQSGDTPNVAVPDELAAVRAQMKALEAREAELKRILLTDPSARTGADWLAEIKEITSNRLDVKELRAEFPAEVDAHTYPIKTQRVELFAIDPETGEITRKRKEIAQ